LIVLPVLYAWFEREKKSSGPPKQQIGEAKNGTGAFFSDTRLTWTGDHPPRGRQGSASEPKNLWLAQLANFSGLKRNLVVLLSPFSSIGAGEELWMRFVPNFSRRWARVFLLSVSYERAGAH